MQTKEIILRKIANTLYINLQMMRSEGLLDGQLGVALFLYHYSRFSGHTHYREVADGLIDKLYGSLALDTDPCFASGLAGIGWTLQHLIDNGFMDGDADEVLEDIDGAVRNMDLASDLDAEIPLFSQGLYFLKRGKQDLVEDVVRKQEVFVQGKDNLPGSYLSSVSYIWGRTPQPFTNLGQKSLDEIDGWVQYRIDNLREEDLMLCGGITGVGLELMKWL